MSNKRSPLNPRWFIRAVISSIAWTNDLISRAGDGSTELKHRIGFAFHPKTVMVPNADTLGVSAWQLMKAGEELERILGKSTANSRIRSVPVAVTLDRLGLVARCQIVDSQILVYSVRPYRLG